MGREFELKYRASTKQMTAILADFNGFREITMETTYYDTPEGSLAPRHWTLRRRKENGESHGGGRILAPGDLRRRPCAQDMQPPWNRENVEAVRDGDGAQKNPSRQILENMEQPSGVVRPD